MRGTCFQVAVPAMWWDQRQAPDKTLALLSVEALDIERRLSKGVDIDRNNRRYIACCREIEEFALRNMNLVGNRFAFKRALSKDRFPANSLSGVYFEFKQNILAYYQDASANARISASFYPPELISQYRNDIKTWLEIKKVKMPGPVKNGLEFIDWARNSGCGLVEFIDIYGSDEKSVNSTEVHPRPPRIAVPDLINGLLGYTSLPVLKEVDRRESEWVLLRQEIKQALRTGRGVNMSNYHHPVISGVLHEHVFGIGESQPGSIDILYEDGSQAEPFPLHCLEQNQDIFHQAEEITPLRFSMVSIRHPEMDPEVDAAWFTNRKASQWRNSIADTDAYCYQRSLKLFKLLPIDSLTVIEIYQTGLPPAVIGFYRALVDVLLSGNARVAVLPKIYRGPGAYTNGEWWV